MHMTLPVGCVAPVCIKDIWSPWVKLSKWVKCVAGLWGHSWATVRLEEKGYLDTFGYLHFSHAVDRVEAKKLRGSLGDTVPVNEVLMGQKPGQVTATIRRLMCIDSPLQRSVCVWAHSSCFLVHPGLDLQHLMDITDQFRQDFFHRRHCVNNLECIMPHDVVCVS